jgi:hypothetical protein
MMTVRYPNGMVVTYNNAMWLIRHSDCWQLLEKEGGQLVVSIPLTAGAAVEFFRPCAVENPLGKLTGEHALEYVLKNIEDLSKTWTGKQSVKQLKKKLASFRPRSGTWAR